MREAIIVGSVVGLFFFAAGAIMTALAIKYATSSSFWDVVLWAGIATMASTVATLGLYISSQINGGPFWVPAACFTAAVFIGTIGLALHLSVSKIDGAPIEGSVFVEVQNLTPLPEVFPAEGRVEVLFLSSEEQLLNGAAEGVRRVVTSIMAGPPGTKINWPKPKKPSQWGTPAARIEITNDITGGGPLFDFTLPIHVGLGMAPNNRTVDSNLILIRLDSGASNRRVLYVANGFGETIGVTFGYVAFARKSDSPEMKQVKIEGSLSNLVSRVIILFVLPDFPKIEPPAPSNDGGASDLKKG